jgi:HSP20 family protein
MSPFALMRRLMEDMGRLFQDVAGISGQAQRARGPDQASWAPQMEVFEQDGDLVVRVDLPGLKLEDLRVEVLDDTRQRGKRIPVKGEGRTHALH